MSQQNITYLIYLVLLTIITIAVYFLRLDISTLTVAIGLVVGNILGVYQGKNQQPPSATDTP
jgi:xanthine/uracil permease